jgi:hypothetical protein
VFDSAYCTLLASKPLSDVAYAAHSILRTARRRLASSLRLFCTEASISDLYPPWEVIVEICCVGGGKRMCMQVMNRRS